MIRVFMNRFTLRPMRSAPKNRCQLPIALICQICTYSKKLLGARQPHPFNPGKTLATAFVVRRVHHPIKLLDGPSVEWFSKGKWREDEIPTRPEYLIRRGGKIGMREVSAVLELTPPYLAIVRL